MTVLARNLPKGYCCSCLAKMLAIPEQQVRKEAQWLVLHDAQLRIQLAPCTNCGRRIDVLHLATSGTVEGATPQDMGSSDPICPVCLEPIKATDKVHGIGADLMHEGCDYTRPAASKLPPQAT